MQSLKCKDIVLYEYHQSDTTGLAIRMDSKFYSLLLLFIKKIKTVRVSVVNETKPAIYFSFACRLATVCIYLSLSKFDQERKPLS